MKNFLVGIIMAGLIVFTFSPAVGLTPLDKDLLEAANNGQLRKVAECFVSWSKRRRPG